MDQLEILMVDLKRAHERAWRAGQVGDQAAMAIALGQAEGLAKRIAEKSAAMPLLSGLPVVVGTRAN